MITTFHDDDTNRVWEGEFSKKLPVRIQAEVRRKLRMINNARRIDDLRIPPNNRLELLKESRKGHWSIRINDQWRVCFVWSDGNAERLEICDYH
ncbi:MAG: type II toxin-antitoxin system RelE/ParE family toxin [Methylococcales bacterium]|nr:type II toxin-antitoxin system RelE/ParE family toxin [Methylococcales bacterium]